MVTPKDRNTKRLLPIISQKEEIDRNAREREGTRMGKKEGRRQETSKSR